MDDVVLESPAAMGQTGRRRAARSPMLGAGATVAAASLFLVGCSDEPHDEAVVAGQGTPISTEATTASTTAPPSTESATVSSEPAPPIDEQTLIDRQVRIGYLPEEWTHHEPHLQDVTGPDGTRYVTVLYTRTGEPGTDAIGISVGQAPGLGDLLATGDLVNDGEPRSDTDEYPVRSTLQLATGQEVWEGVSAIHGAQFGFAWALDSDTTIHVTVPVSLDRAEAERIATRLEVIS